MHLLLYRHTEPAALYLAAMENRTIPIRPSRSILLAFAAAVCIKAFFFDIMIAEGRSMIPTIAPGTLLLVHKAAYGIRIPFGNTYAFRWGSPRVGDIIIFLSPDGKISVKRCAAISGDDGFFAIGDNTAESYDSRSYGPLPNSVIGGKVLGFK